MKLKINKNIKYKNTNSKYWYPLSIPTYDVKEIKNALNSLINFKTSMWKKTFTFEEKFKNFNKSKFATMVNSGSSADLLACYLIKKKLNEKNFKNVNKEIIVPVVTWPTQIWSIVMAGFKVRFVDVNHNNLNIDISEIKKNINKNTVAIFVVHLMGNPCDMSEITKIAKKNKLYIIEDCCEALGAKFNNKLVGNFGLAGTFSFFFSHHLVTMEGGMIVTNDLDLRNETLTLRAHGWLRNTNLKFNESKYKNIDPNYAFTNWGFNLRPTEVQSAFGLEQIKKIKKFNKIRVVNFNIFKKYIKKYSFLKLPKVHKKAKPSWFGIPILVEKNSSIDKNYLVKELNKNGVETRPIVTGNFMKQPAIDEFDFLKIQKKKRFRGADIIHDNGFYIGLSPATSKNDFKKLIGVFDKIIKKKIRINPHHSHYILNHNLP